MLAMRPSRWGCVTVARASSCSRQTRHRLLQVFAPLLGRQMFDLCARGFEGSDVAADREQQLGRFVLGGDQPDVEIVDPAEHRSEHPFDMAPVQQGVEVDALEYRSRAVRSNERFGQLGSDVVTGRFAAVRQPEVEPHDSLCSNIERQGHGSAWSSRIMITGLRSAWATASSYITFGL